MTGADIISSFKRQPVGFICGAICLLCGLRLYFTVDSIADGETTSEQKATEARKIEANVLGATNLAEQTAALLAATRELEGRLIRPAQLAINQQYFYRLESDTGVKLLDIQQSASAAPKAGAKAALFVGVPFNVSIEGRLPQVLSFLRRLENGRHFARFNNISVNKATGSDSPSGSLTVAINVELLSLP